MRDIIAIIPDVHLRTPFAERALGNDRCASSAAQTDEVKRNLERLQPVVEKYGY